MLLLAYKRSERELRNHWREIQRANSCQKRQNTANFILNSSELIRQITFFSKLSICYSFLVKNFPRLNSVASFE